MSRWITVVLIPLIASCASSGGGDNDGGTNNVQCTLRDDKFGPGQYSDECVQADWVSPYAGAYSSATCDVTIAVPATGAPVFDLTVKSGPLAGTYSLQYEGGKGRGNDSYYRFTTDATYSETKRINFGVGKEVDSNEEQGLSFSVENLTTTPTYTATFQRTLSSPFSNQTADCGALIRAP